MAWLRIDDAFADHPKVLALSNSAFRLHVSAMCYAANQLTDGVITPASLRRLGWSCDDIGADVTQLVDAGLWDVDPDGYRIHDYLEYNPSAEQVRADRDAAKERMRKVRQNQQRNDNGKFAGSSEDVRANIGRTSENVHRPPSPSPFDQEREREAHPTLDDLLPKRLGRLWEQTHGRMVMSHESGELRDMVSAHGEEAVAAAIVKSQGKYNPIAYTRTVAANHNGDTHPVFNGKPAKPKDGRSPIIPTDPNADGVTYTVIDL